MMKVCMINTASQRSHRCKMAMVMAVSLLALVGCSVGPSAAPLPFYRCEYGIEFTAKFIGDSVALDSVRGYDILHRSDKPHVYSNPRVNVEFNLGVLGREAIVRYPLLPLAARCVRDN
jgi:hypothetical protein